MAIMVFLISHELYILCFMYLCTFWCMQKKLDSLNLDISHVIIFANTCNWCFDTINFNFKKWAFLYFFGPITYITWNLYLFTFVTMYKDTNPPFKTTVCEYKCYKSRIPCWSVSLWYLNTSYTFFGTLVMMGLGRVLKISFFLMRAETV